MMSAKTKRHVLSLALGLVTLSATAHGQESTPDLAGCVLKQKAYRIVRTKERPAPQPSPGKAVIYIVRGKISAISLSEPCFDVTIDNQWVGASCKDSYFFVEVDPGFRTVCAKATGFRQGGSDPGLLAITTESARSYFLEAAPGFGRTFLNELSEEEGEKRIRKFRFLTFVPK